MRFRRGRAFIQSFNQSIMYVNFVLVDEGNIGGTKFYQKKTFECQAVA